MTQTAEHMNRYSRRYAWAEFKTARSAWVALDEEFSIGGITTGEQPEVEKRTRNGKPYFVITLLGG